MNPNVVICGIMSRENYIKRTIRIAKGEYRPRKDEPKIWFESLQAMTQILSRDNLELLWVIAEKRPESITALAKLTGRHKGNLSRTLNRMEEYGIVALENGAGKVRRPIAKATDFDIRFGLKRYSFMQETPE